MRADVLSRVGLVALTLTLGLLATSCGGGGANHPIKIAFISDCTSPFSKDLRPVLAGAELPFLRRGAKLRGTQPARGVTEATIVGKRVQLLLNCESYPNFATLTEVLRQDVENDHVDIVVGTDLTGEGLVVKQYAREHPGVTFVTRSGEQSTTLENPAPNVFGFAPDSAQESAGLGAYAYRTRGWRNVAIVGENDPYGWGEVAGFAAEFCSLGGHIIKPIWTEKVGSIARLVTKIPSDGVDGVVLPSSLLRTRSFMRAWAKRHPNFGGELLVNADSNAFQPPLKIGTFGLVGVSSGPLVRTAEDHRYADASRRMFPGIQGTADLSSYDTMERVLEALGRVHGDLSHKEGRYRHALARLHFTAPDGQLMSLDGRRQAIVQTYLRQVQKGAEGKLVVRQIAVVPNVEQTFGGYFGPNTHPPSRHPLCRRKKPPAWVRSVSTTR